MATTDPTSTTAAATTATATAVTNGGGDLDQGRVEAFTQALMGHYTGAFVTLMVDLGDRTGLWSALARGPATSEELAARAGLVERYVREWLGAVASAGIVDYDAPSAVYALRPEHAACLSGDGALNLAPVSVMAGHLAAFLAPVAQAFREGGGVPYERYRPEFTDVMDGLNRRVFDELLVEGILPLAGDLAGVLEAGTRVADVGCGTGHSTNLLARAFPASAFVGYDLAEDALDRGRVEAAAYGLGNVSFVRGDAARLPAIPPVGAAFAFDAIHDQVDPAGVLGCIHAALEPGGTFVMVDVRASSRLEANLANPMAPIVYATSTLHCLTVSLAGGGAGLGTAWGEELACRMLVEAGFGAVEVYEAPGDPLNSVYVARRLPAG